MTEQQPRIPGVRYRKVRRTTWEPVTFNGETKLVKREWTEEVPRLPLNLDALYVRAAVGVAVLLTCVAVVWSTMAIGRQLGHLVPEYPKVGYLGAAAFELPWVTCLAVAWVLRNQPDRARPVNVAGWVGLGIVVGAIVLDGYRVGSVAVGVLGAFVSVVAKGLWWVVIGLFRVDLDEDRAGWLNAVRQDLAVERVMLGEQQRMSAVEAYLAHFGVGPAASARPALAASSPAELPSAPAVPASAPAPSAPAVPPSAPAPAAAPSVPSVPVSAQVPAPPVSPSAPSAPAPSAPAPQPSAPSAVPSVPAVQPSAGGQPTPIGAPTISGTVAALIAADPGLRERRDELVRRVAEAHPAKHAEDPDKFRATVLRNLRTKVETRRGRRATG